MLETFLVPQLGFSSIGVFVLCKHGSHVEAASAILVLIVLRHSPPGESNSLYINSNIQVVATSVLPRKNVKPHWYWADVMQPIVSSGNFSG